MFFFFFFLMRDRKRVDLEGKGSKNAGKSGRKENYDQDILYEKRRYCQYFFLKDTERKQREKRGQKAAVV